MKKILISLMAAGLLFGCAKENTGANDTSAGTTNNTTTTANDQRVMSSGDVMRDIDQVAGQNVVVEDEIDGVYGTRMYKLGDDILLILTTDADLRDDQKVRATGTVERAGSASSEIAMAPEGERENLAKLLVLRADSITPADD